MRTSTSSLLVIAGLLVASTVAQPADRQQQHLGVASCATSVCHGKLRPAPHRDVALNEYRTWIHDDPHSRAYRTLQTPRSKRMAQLLGIPDAATAKVCLDCHADNVPQEQRGPKFRLDDGVGCEACHGGSGLWIETHAATSSEHADNLARGMYPLEQPLSRASLCLSCHLGTRDRVATHRIYAAGHPRLTFELESFTMRQPPHFIVDGDYEQRKGKASRTELWLAGQLESTRAMLDLLRAPAFKSEAGFPEPAFYDCSSCHHSMQRYQWNAQRFNGGLQPGALRLQMPNLLVLQTIAATLAPDRGAELAQLSEQLVRAGAHDVAAVADVASRLSKGLTKHQALLHHSLSRAQATRLRIDLVELAASDKVADYSTAEQVYFGLESLSYSLDDFSSKQAVLDVIYEAIDDSPDFSPQQFARASRVARRGF